VRLHAVPINEPEFEERKVVGKDARYLYGDVSIQQRHKLSLRADLLFDQVPSTQIRPPSTSSGFSDAGARLLER
jgi:hypothetical protein